MQIRSIQLESPLRHILDTELSERETYLIGSIVSQWGFLEADIFDQTLLSFEGCESLPAAMNKNAQFSAVLKLWLERVVESNDGARKAVLKAQYDKIISLNEFRQAVVHSRWEWTPSAPHEITAVRVHNKSIKRVKFTSDDLADFAADLGEIRYAIRYPGGVQDRAKEMAAVGGYISRRGWDLLGGRLKIDDSTDRSDTE
ncbi:hypothetical protein [Pelagibacterium sp.]|uniref:hypothetical protein n=1 Tax=Pelagibacterium sp. TaxID=1967288 RepID=UPI003BACAA85